MAYSKAGYDKYFLCILLSFGIFLGLLMTGCEGQVSSLPEADLPSLEAPTVGKIAAPLPTLTNPATLTKAAPVGTVAQESSLQPSLTPTLDSRLPPEAWMDWPVVPVATTRAREIYQQGVALGNNPRSFSKIGDCQAIKEVLMGIYDIPDRYTLAPGDQSLQKTIDNFAGSFNRDGMAVRGGFNAAAVLSPIWSDPKYCQPGENPVACEIRMHKPSFIIISLEVWWEGRTVERYEAYMRQILDYAISKGVVPILSTKADNVEKDNSINLVNVHLAYEYDLPLWNFWRAVQPLPNHGIDPNRDGFHISVEAWNVRSFTALQALDSVWRGVTQGEAPATSTPSPSATTILPAETPVPSLPVVTLVSPGTPQTTNQTGDTGKFAFSVAERNGETIEQKGVYTFDFARESLVQVVGAGFSLQAVSPSGQQMLVNKANELYLAQLDGSSMSILSDQFFAGGETNAFWLSSGQYIVVIANRDGQNAAWLVASNGASWVRLTPSGTNVVGLLPAADLTRVYWQKGSCTGDGTCIAESTWYTLLDGSDSQELAGVLRPAFSPDGNSYVFSDPQNDSNLVVTTLDGTRSRVVPFPDDKDVDSFLLGYSWAPDGERLSLLVDVRSKYNGKSLRVRNLLLNPKDLGLKAFADLAGLNLHSTWSANSQTLLISGTSEIAEGYQLMFRLFDLESKSTVTLDDKISLKSAGFLYITRVSWVPPG